MKCTSLRCKNDAVLVIDRHPWCAHDGHNFIGLYARINTANGADTCDACGAPIIADFYAQDIKGRIFCSLSCAYSRNGVKKLEDSHDDNT